MKGKSPLFIIFATIFIDLLGFGIVLPLSPYYAEHFGASAFQVGLLQASYSLMQFFFAPVWGRLSDRVGRRPILMMSILGGSAAYMMFAFASSLTILFASRILQGIFAANLSAAQAYIADTTTPENRSKGMGVIGAAFGLGFIFGPAIGAYLSQIGTPLGMGFPAFVASLLCLVNFMVAYFKLPESLKPEIRRAQVRESRFEFFLRATKRSHVAWLVLVFFLLTFAIANMEATFALFTEARLGYGIRETGYMFAFVGFMMAFTQGYLIRKLLPRLGERKMMVAGPFFSAIGLGGVAFAHSTSSMILFMLVLAIGSGITNPSVMGGISLVTDESEQGTMMGLTQSLGSLGRVVGPACGGYLFKVSGPAAPYLLASMTMFFILGLSLFNVKKLPDVGKINAFAH